MADIARWWDITVGYPAQGLLLIELIQMDPHNGP